MNELEPTIKAFEEACACTITLHDRMHILYDGTSPLMLISRHSHRKTFPEGCGLARRDDCIRRCDIEVDAYIEKEQPRAFVKRCKYGFTEVVSPVFRSGVHVVTFFAGIWRKPVDASRIAKLEILLPVFANGLIAMATGLRGAIHGSDAMATRIHEYISLNYNRSVSTTDLAKALSLSLTRTCHVVHQHCGDTFESLLMKERLFHAKLYLKSSSYRVNEIARLCGFNSVEHFNRSFKKRLGYTPSAVRKPIKRGGI